MLKRKQQNRAGIFRRSAWTPAMMLFVFVLAYFQVGTALSQIVNEVTASGTFEGSVYTATATESVTVEPANPALVVNKLGILNDDVLPAGISAGDTIDYEITAENTGNITLTNVTASDPLLPGANLVFDAASDVDSDGELDVGETWRWTGSYALDQVTDIDTAGGGDNDIDNTVTINADELPGPETASEEVPLVPTSEITVAKTGVFNDIDATPGQSAGDVVDYTVTVRNTGNTTINITTVSDPMVSLTWDGIDAGSDGVLLPGEIWTYTGTYVLQQSDFDTNGGGDGMLDNTVTVSTSQLPDETDTFSLPLTPVTSVDIAKVADITGVSGPGDPIAYTVTATNTGTVTLTNVTVSDPMLTPNSLVCPSVAPGDACVLNGTYAVTGADLANGTVQNTATVTTDEGETDNVILDTPLTATPALTVAKTASPTVISAAGTAVSYTVSVQNTGNVPLTGITVSDPMLTLDCGSGSATIANLAPGTPQLCTGTYVTQQADIDAGSDIINTASATDDGTYGVSDSDMATITFTQTPSMLVSKSGVLNDDDGIGGVSAGDTILYTVSLQNTGNVSLTGVVANDPMAALTLVSGDTDSDLEIDPSETWVFEGSYALLQSDIDSDGGGDGNIENTVTVSTGELPDQTASTDVPLNLAPSYDVVKVGVLNDDDGDAGLTEGDTVTYTVTLTNTGNLRLTNVTPSDPMLTLTGPAGDTNSDNRLDVDEVWTYTGTTIVTQADLDTLGGGDGDIDNTVTVTTDQLPDQDASHELPLAPVSSMEVDKIAMPAVRLFPTVFEFDYVITVTNTGAVTQTNIRVDDDLVAALAPASIIGMPTVAVTGFAGTGGANPGYDGAGDIAILTGDVQLAPGASGEITITTRIDTGAQTINGLNTAFLDSDQITTPIPSDDPSRTPGDDSDTNPTPVDLPDSDNDGASDDDEDLSGDRDGDGTINSQDYDPTGYFYCQSDGRILTGGLIRVENLTSGGSVSGVGSGSGIVILRDGSDGLYQFHVTQPGTYRLSFDSLPPVGTPSTTLTSSGLLDVGTPPDNPRVIGSGEFGSTGILDDFSEAANPFYTLFEIESGDPAVFNNNIPMQFCGTAQISVEKTLVSGPDIQADLSHDVTYRMTIEATGNEPVLNVQMLDNLDAVFGAGNYSVTSLTLDSAPAGFTETTDPFFNGSGNTALLTSGGTLQPGESVSVLMALNVNVLGGVYSNVVTGNGENPLDNSPVPSATDDADITISAPSDLITVEKTALPGSAPIGAPVAYTIKVTNNSTVDVIGVEIVDLIPNGMSFIQNSGRIDGVAASPANDAGGGSGRELVFAPVDIAAGGNVTVNLALAINASAADTEFINNAWVRNPVTGETISNIAKARVLLEIEPVFQCSDVIGRVFDDLDKDGYADDGEPGLAGVRLATPNGLLIVTDKFGRYSIACGAIPDEDIGSNFILKLDTRTLPTGYRVTSENPRVIRLTRGKLAKLNFAAANLRVVRLELGDLSFKRDTNRPTEETIRALGGLLAILDEEPSVLRMVYQVGDDGREKARSRMRETRQLMESAWSGKDRVNELLFETRLVD